MSEEAGAPERELDLRHLKSPMQVVVAAQQLKEMNRGAVLKVVASEDVGRDFTALTRARDEIELIEASETADGFAYVLRWRRQ